MTVPYAALIPLCQLALSSGAEHVVLGTDYPYDMAMDRPVDFIDGAKLSSREKTAIMGGNAARLLKM